MEKPAGYDNAVAFSTRANKHNRYDVFVNGVYYGETTAVSRDKAANNIRWKIYEEYSDWRYVPSIHEIDCIEV